MNDSKFVAADSKFVAALGSIEAVLLFFWLRSYSVPWTPATIIAILAGIGVSRIARRFLGLG